MTIAFSFSFFGSFAVLLFIIGKAAVQTFSMPEKELRYRRRMLSGWREVLETVLHALKKWLHVQSLLKFLEIVLRRTRIYVLKFENLLQRGIHRTRGGSLFKTELKQTYWNKMQKWQAETNGNGSGVNHEHLDSEDFLSLHLHNKDEAFEWFGLND